MNIRRLMLHHDNAPSDTAKMTIEFFKQKGMKVNPPYSVGLGMCEFWLLFNLKKIYVVVGFKKTRLKKLHKM